MKILKLNNQDYNEAIAQAVAVLRRGGLFIFPTETCYGLGADATNQTAVDRLFQYKTKRNGKPLSVVASDKQMAQGYVQLNEMAETLYDEKLPGPFTVISKSLGNVAQGVASEASTLGIRIPDYKLILDIAREFGKPFTATSANVSDLPAPYSINTILNQTSLESLSLIDLIIDAGDLPPRPPSTIIDTTKDKAEIIR